MTQVIEKTVTQRTPNAIVTESKTQDTPSQTVMYLIYFLSGVLDLLLAFRFVLKLTGANPATAFVKFIYGMTQIFVMPFRGIFPAATTQGAVTTAVFEPQTLVAIVVYAAIAWGIVRLVEIFSRQSE
jgi:hypothetical protein